MYLVKLLLLILCGLVTLTGVIALIKNQVTYRNHMMIVNAIFEYSMDAIKKARENKTIIECGVEYEVDYSDMRDYNSTFLRVFDWGYKHILPEDKFEIIKPYIHK